MYFSDTLSQPRFDAVADEKGDENMISYGPLFQTMKDKGVTTYRLVMQHNISRSLLNRLKHNKPISTVTLEDLCRILHCRVQDVIEYIPESTELPWCQDSEKSK